MQFTYFGLTVHLRRFKSRALTVLTFIFQGSHGLEAVKAYQLTTMTKEKKRIERELEKIREGRYSQRGRGFGTQISLRQSSGQDAENDRDIRRSGLPAISPRRATAAVSKTTELSSSPTDIEEELELSRKSRELKAILEAQNKSLQEKVNQFIGVDERSKRKARDSPRLPRGENGMEINMDEVKESIAKRLASKSSLEINEEQRLDTVPILPDIQDAPGKVNSLVAPGSQKKNDLQSVEDFLANPVFNPELYAPDGHVRTLHTLPNFKDSFDEAKKARYLRMGKGELLPSEVPLSVNEIFAKNEEIEAWE
ncbi:Hypp4595 [Branchiostoma lanceolatum]|uniref:Hypp4595 protein n=1 Tax=Branchiostoma lanceolatum TaxID=7740 RepID=A0A8K0A8W7_BRALA|nr:Hypp4595 [Branchiostoma lanceolatum]